MPIKAAFFDFYGTVAGFHPSREWIQMEAARHFDLALDLDGIVRGYAAADEFMTLENARGHINRRPEAARKAFFTRYEQLILEAATGRPVPLDLAAQVWRRVFATPSSMAAFPDVRPTLEQLKQRGLILGLISNAPRSLEDDCQRIGILPLLDFIMTSLLAGAEKPNPRIFQAALDKAGVKPSEAVHVGDQYEGDIVGARAAGMRAILLDRDGQYGRFENVERIETLTALLELLARGT